MGFSITVKDLMSPALRVWSFLEVWGWIIIFCIIAIYVAYPYIVKAYNEMRSKQQLKEATNPERVKILEAERNRIREEQQAKWLVESKRLLEEKKQAKRLQEAEKKD
jgi:large-conductance mechanosensitive channel